MSHFSVLVAGDVDSQLAPYHEYECTGYFDEYVEPVDMTDELMREFEEQSEYKNFEDFLEYMEGEFPVFYSYQKAVEFSKKMKSVFVFAVKNSYDKIEKFYRFTNPNAKWDWYVIGGRWSNFLLGKDGKRYNSLKKKDIDTEKMKKLAAQSAKEDYEAFENFLKENNIENVDKMTREQMMEFNKQQGYIFFPEDFKNLSKEEFIENAKNHAFASFAFVKDGVWHEKGSMGWFALVSDEKSDWLEIFNDLFESVDDEEILTVVDCHI